MSVCLDKNTTDLPSPVGKLPETSEADDQPNNSSDLNADQASNFVPKLVVAPLQENVTIVPVTTALTKVGNTPVITVVNTPITVVKTVGNTTAPLFTLVNSTAKCSQATTLLNSSSLTVFKTNQEPIVQEKSVNNGSLSVQPSMEKTLGIHNVFVKKNTPTEEINSATLVPDVPQSHKLLTANSFPTSNLISNINTGPILKTANGQRNASSNNKVKVMSNVLLPGNSSNNVDASQNVILNKTQRYYQQKQIGNGATKYLNKSSDRTFYPVSKNPMKNMPGYKPLSAPLKNLNPGTIQRTGTGLRTIPPQRPNLPSKPNYIGKHAVQAQKIKSRVKSKAGAVNTGNRIQHQPEQSAQMIFNQALTAQILETLSDNEPANSSLHKMNNIKPYSNNKYEVKHDMCPKSEHRESKNHAKSLEALSFVCQAVLLDHNYNATLPSENTSPVPAISPPNGAQQFSPVPHFPLGPNLMNKRNCPPVVVPTITHDDDAASDISEERKNDTEGEETDTAPEAEAVTNEVNDRYGDYVTRCVCGFIHDDGYMIECDKCKVWQHVRCVVKTKKVPDDYLCEICDPSKFTDRQKARALQQQWMRDIQERDAKLRKEQMALSDTDSSEGEMHKTRRKEPPRRRKEAVQNRNLKPVRRKEKKVKKTRTKQVLGKSDDEKLPQLRQWIENYEEAVTNHYSPELRARISNARLNGAHSELSGTVDPSVYKCKVQSIPPGVKCLVADASLPMGTPVIELRGKYMLSTQHRASTRQQRPGPFLFFHTIIKETEICVDTRTYGNCARFIRRSCTPNAELQHVLEKGAVHLYIVTTKSIDKGTELTIRHETHDIAAAHLTEIPCACINPEYCALIKGHKRFNGDVIPEGRKRRGRQNRENSITSPTPQLVPIPEPEIKDQEEEEEEEIPPEVMEPVVKEEIKPEIIEEPPVEEEAIVKDEIETEIKEENVKEVKEEDCNIIKEEVVKKEIKEEIVEEKVKPEIKTEEIKDEVDNAPPPPVTTRRASRHSQEHQENANCTSSSEETQNKKLSREERKLQAIMKAIERMEKQEQRKQEHQAKQAHRRESDPIPTVCHKEEQSKGKRKKRKGRARTMSTNTRRSRLDSIESMHSSDDTLLSPTSDSTPSKAAGLLLSLSNGEAEHKSPERTMDSNSNSAHSSPETQLSSACLLVAAAVEPLEPGFKFPKTKKVLMNEWLNKSDVVQSASSISPSSLTPHIDTTLNNKNNNNSSDQTKSGSAKKRWLRQAISEDQCDSPPQENLVAPPKKRRLHRESLSMDDSPPENPITVSTPQPELNNADESNPLQIDSETALNEVVSEIRQEMENCIDLPPMEIITNSSPPPSHVPSVSILDPRLARFSTSEQLVGTVEKTLSFLGFDPGKKPEAITPAKRKLSITEYRQRKKLNNNEKGSGEDMLITEESNSSQSPKISRIRTNSSSSLSSNSSIEDDLPLIHTEVKALSAFNSEPTELERQRESASLRLKTLGLSVNVETSTTNINVEALLKGEVSPIMTSPSTNLPETSSSCNVDEEVPTPVGLKSPIVCVQSVLDSSPSRTPTDISLENSQEVPEFKSDDLKTEEESKDTLFYTPDDDEDVDEEISTCNVFTPPFEQPTYSSTYGSVIDDHVPYEGRNPSPPPDLSKEA